MAVEKSRRSGVALIIVLGLVAILMIVSVAFTIHMRVERAGAANLRHAAIARQVVKGGLAAALMAIDKHAGGSAVPEWYNPGDITSPTYRPFKKFRDGTEVRGSLWRDTFISFNTNNTVANEDKQVNTRYGQRVSGGVDARIFSSEVENYFPKGLAYRGYSTAYIPLAKNGRPDVSSAEPIIQPQWQPVFADVQNDNVMGRYAFFVLDTTGLLDASCVTGGSRDLPRWMGRDSEEIDLAIRDANGKAKASILPEVSKEEVGGELKFCRENSDNGTYETLAEFQTLNTHILNNRSFKTLSYDPGPTNKLVFIGGSADDIRAHRDEIIKAFYYDCGLTAGKEISIGGKKYPEQACWAYLGLVDYVDGDSKMEELKDGDKVLISARERPVTERMPLVSGFIGELTIKARQTCTRTEDGAEFDLDKTPVQVKVSAKVKVPFVFPFIPDYETDADIEEFKNFKLEGKAGFVVNNFSRSETAVGDCEPRQISPTGFSTEYVVTPLEMDAGDDGWVNVGPLPSDGQFTMPIADQLELPNVEVMLRVGGATYYKENNNKETIQHSYPVNETYYEDFEEPEYGMVVKFVPQDEGVKFDSDDGGNKPENPKVHVWERNWVTNVLVWAEIVDPRFSNKWMAKSNNADRDDGVWMACCKVSHGAQNGDLGIPLSKIRKELSAFSGFSDAEKILTRPIAKACGLWDDTTDDYGEYFEGKFYNPQVNDDEYTMPGASPFVSYLLTHPEAVKALYGMPMDGIQRGTAAGHTDKALQKLRMFVKNGPLESVGELGYLPIGMWQTIRLYDYCDDFGNSDSAKTTSELHDFNNLPLYETFPEDETPNGTKHKRFFHPVLDYFTVVPDTEDVKGRVNINTLNMDILAVPFHNMPIVTEDGIGKTSYAENKPERIDREETSRKDLPSITCLAEAIVEYRENKRGYIRNLSELGYLFSYGDVSSGAIPLMYGASGDDLSYAAQAVQKAAGAAEWGEWEREAVIRNSCGLFTTRGQTFIVVVRGESYSPPFGRKKSMKGGTSNSSKTAIAEVWRDSVEDNTGNHPMFVQFFKIIDD